MRNSEQDEFHLIRTKSKKLRGSDNPVSTHSWEPQTTTSIFPTFWEMKLLPTIQMDPIFVEK